MGQEPGRTQRRKEANLEQTKEAPGRLFPVVRNNQLVQLCRSWGVAASIRLWLMPQNHPGGAPWIR